MVLPAQFFNTKSDIPNELLSLEDNIDLTDKINSGDIDIEAFEKKTEIGIPELTIAPAPKPQNIPAKEENISKDQNNLGPSEDEIKRLESIENMLIDLENKIKNISDLESTKTDEPVKSKSEQLLDEKLKEPLAGDSSKVEILPQQNLNFNTTNQQNTKIFNNDKLKDFITKKETLLKERDTILQNYNKTFLNNNEQKTNFNIAENNNEDIKNLQNITENNNTSNIDKTTATNLTNVVNKNYKNQATENFSVENFAQNLLKETQKSVEYGSPIQPQNVTQSEEKNNTNILNNEFNSLIENITRETNNITDQKADSSIEPQIDIPENKSNNDFKLPPLEQASAVEPINTPLTDEIQQKELDEAFNIKGNSVENKLPPARDSLGDNAKAITGLLEGIKEGIIKLNDGLGNRFSKLTESMQNMKSSIVNNSYTTNQNPGQDMNSNKVTQRSVLPDYRGDYPEPGDFPKGFDVTKLGGTNLPNPPQII